MVKKRPVITKRDFGILKLMGEFGGKTFTPVLAKTFWHGKKIPVQASRDRINILKNKYKLLKLIPSGLMSPKNVIALSEYGKRFTEDEGIKNTFVSFSPVTVNHLILEQITYFWLQEIGKNPKRTVVKNWALRKKREISESEETKFVVEQVKSDDWSKQNKYNHTPDIAYKIKEKLVYVEVELSKKRPEGYIDIFNKIKKDGVKSVLYVFESKKKMLSIGKVLPIWDKVFYVDIDTLIESAQTGKLGAIKQEDFLRGLSE
jgi:hypothetical protein